MEENPLCLVGNIVQEHEYGDDFEMRKGTRHFAPGAKVYLSFPPFGGGMELAAIGKPRHTSSYIEVILPATKIENFRVQRVYKPAVLKRMEESKYDYWKNETEDSIRDMADNFERWTKLYQGMAKLKVQCNRWNPLFAYCPPENALAFAKLLREIKFDILFIQWAKWKPEDDPDRYTKPSKYFGGFFYPFQDHIVIRKNTDEMVQFFEETTDFGEDRWPVFSIEGYDMVKSTRNLADPVKSEYLRLSRIHSNLSAPYRYNEGAMTLNTIIQKYGSEELKWRLENTEHYKAYSRIDSVFQQQILDAIASKEDTELVLNDVFRLCFHGKEEYLLMYPIEENLLLIFEDNHIKRFTYRGMIAFLNGQMETLTDEDIRIVHPEEENRRKGF